VLICWQSPLCCTFLQRHIPPALLIQQVSESWTGCLTTTNKCSGGDIFVLHRESSTASSRRRSLQAARRSLENLPRIITSDADRDSRSTYHVPTSPFLVITSPPVSSRGSLENEPSAVKDIGEIEITEGNEGSGSNLDPNSIPLRVVYSPTVSRSGSVGHSDRPSTVFTHEEQSETEPQLLSPDEDSAQARSFQAPRFSESSVHRRSRNNSYTSNLETRQTARPASFSTQRSPSPIRRLAFEESGRRDQIHAPPVFVAFPQTKWFRPMLAAKTILAFVCCAVLGNLIYT
jgi:hypothetical protein